MSAPGHEPIASYVAKWHRREPEMAQAEVFCPEPLRPRFRAWGALVHELREAAFEISEARVAEVKRQWWSEELLGVADGRARHPVTGPLRGEADLAALARALVALGEHDGRPGDAAQARAQLRPLSQALAASEAGLFGQADTPEAADAVAVHLLLHRLPDGLLAEDQAGLPMNLLARHGVTAADVAAGRAEPLLRDWGRDLLEALPPAGAQPVLFRRLRSGFDRARLARLVAGRGFAPPGPFLSLLRAWRLARQG